MYNPRRFNFHAAFTVKACDRLVIVGKRIADADLITLIAGLGVRLHFLQSERDMRQIRLKGQDFCLVVSAFDLIKIVLRRGYNRRVDL